MTALFLYFFRFLIVGSVVFLFVGMFKPEWLRFRGKQPDIVMTIVIALGLFMLGLTGVTKTFHTVEIPDTAESKAGLALSAATYVDDVLSKDCKRGSKPGKTGASDDEQTADGIRFAVRTPSNYKETHAHPLLMVYAPAGRDREEAEQFMYLTREATAAGFIIAYVDHHAVSPGAVVQLGEIPLLIEQKWCVDKKRIFMTGHSDGGTIAMGAAFFNGTKHIPTAIAPSAVGIRGDDLQDRNCPKPTPVMLMHSNRDKLFPNYGKEAIEWWARCNKCTTKTYSIEDRKKLVTKKTGWEGYYRKELEQKAEDLKAGKPLPFTTPVAVAPGCVAYSGCKNDVQTWYCESSDPHPQWPGRNKEIVAFFKTVSSRLGN